MVCGQDFAYVAPVIVAYSGASLRAAWAGGDAGLRRAEKTRAQEAERDRSCAGCYGSFAWIASSLRS